MDSGLSAESHRKACPILAADQDCGGIGLGISVVAGQLPPAIPRTVRPPFLPHPDALSLTSVVTLKQA